MTTIERSFGGRRASRNLGVLAGSAVGLGLLLLANACVRGADDDVGGDPLLHPNFQRTVTISRPRIYLGELLEVVSQQVGVSVSADEERWPLGGIPLTLRADGVPASRLLAAVRETLNTPYNAMEWRPARDGEPGALLRAQRSAADAAGVARRDLLDSFRRGVRRIWQAARKPDGAREIDLRGMTGFFPGTKDPLPQHHLDVLAAIRSAELEEMLQGGRVTLSAHRISARGRGTLPQTPADPAAQGDGEPSFSFHLEFGPAYLGPVLWLSNEAGARTNLLGGAGWDRKWINDELKDWIYVDHPTVRDLQARIRARDPGSAGKPIQVQRPADWAVRFAELQKTPVLADLVNAQANTVAPTARLGASPDITARMMVLDMDVMHRTLKECFLFRHVTALTDDRPSLVRWRTIRSLRKAARDNAGFLDLDSLALLVSLTPAQARGLVWDFPDAHPDKLGPWVAPLLLHDNLTPAAQRRLSLEEGIRWSDAGLVARAAFLGVPDRDDRFGGMALRSPTPDTRVRLRIEAAPVDPVRGESKVLTWTVFARSAVSHSVRWKLTRSLSEAEADAR